MAEFFLPVLSHFQNRNAWLSSAGRLRYRIVPTLTDEEGNGILTAEGWEGPWAYEFSQVEETAQFPLTPEGLEALAEGITIQSQAVNSRPERSLEENLARRKDPEQATEKT